MKTYTVSVKHYLNTTLKPSVVDGKLYYPVYLMINAKRKTSRIKSLVFLNNYTVEQFKEKNECIKEKIVFEIGIIERILRLTVRELKEYNTTFFNAYTNFCFDAVITMVDINKYCYKWDGLNFKFLNSLFLKDLSSSKKSLRILDFFSNEIQKDVNKELKKQIENNKLSYSATEVLNDFNKMVFYDLLEYFNFYLKGSKKTRELVYKYDLSYIRFHGQKDILSKYNIVFLKNK